METWFRNVIEQCFYPDEWSALMADPRFRAFSESVKSYEDAEAAISFGLHVLYPEESFQLVPIANVGTDVSKI